MIKKELILTREHLKECLDYNPETGELVWKERPKSHFIEGRYSAEAMRRKHNNKYAGKEAGWNQKFEACCARKSAENKYGFHKNHGTVRPL